MYKRKLYLKKIRPFMGKPVIKVIIGMRRVGKSCFMRMLVEELRAGGSADENILFVDKESLDFDHIRTSGDLDKLAADRFKDVSAQKYLFVDEVQEIDQWERAVTSLLNKGDIDIYISGSNAHLLSSELATLISGRYIEFPIYSLGFEEFRLFRGDSKGRRDGEFIEYLRFGGLPAIHYFDLDEEIVYQYVSSIYDTILLKDVVSRNNIRNVQLLENICRFLFDNIGNVFSAKSISDYLKNQKIRVGVDTVQNYLSYITDALLAYKVRRYDVKGKRLLEIHDKYYLGDVGIRHALLGYREGDILGVLENVVFLELMRRGFQIHIGKLGSMEIDFIATREKEKVYLQVAYLLATPETVEREFGVLRQIGDNYPKYVLSMDEAFGEDIDGIRRVNIIDFLTARTELD